MNSLTEIEEKIEEIFCKKKLSDHIEQYGIIRLTEMAFKLVEDLESQTNSKEVYLCKMIIEFLIGLVRNCTSTSHNNNNNSPKYINQSIGSGTNESEDRGNQITGVCSNSKKKRPPTPPKKPKISRNFHSFQYVPSSKENTTQQDLAASNTSLATTISNSSLTNNQNKAPKLSPVQQSSITATRTSSTFGSISKHPQNSSKHTQLSNHQISNQQQQHTKIHQQPQPLQQHQQQQTNLKYTETCLDKDTSQFEENAYEIKDLGFGSSSSSSQNKPNLFSVNSKLMNKTANSSSAGQSSQSHNSFPRQQLHQAHTSSINSSAACANANQQPSTRNSSTSGKKANNFFFQFNQKSNHNHQHTNSLKDSLSYGSTDALCKNSSSAASSLTKNSFFSRKGSLDKHPTSHQPHSYLPDFGRHRNLRLSENSEPAKSSSSKDNLTSDYYSQRTAKDDEEDDRLLDRQKSQDDNGESNNETYVDTEEELDRKDDDTEDEAIYDTVAPDEVQTSSQSSNLASSNNGINRHHQKITNMKANLVASLKSSFENRHLNQSTENLDGNHDTGDNRIYSNYVNIDYFLRSKNDSDDCDTQMSQSLSSDHDIDESIAPAMSKVYSSSNEMLLNSKCTNNGVSNVISSVTTASGDNLNAAYDEVFESKKELSTQHSMDSADDLDDEDVIRSEAELLSMYRSIIQNIIESESVYIDCLDTLIKYKKALKSSTESTNPLLTPEQLECIFYQIPELYRMHSEFITGVEELSYTSGDSSAIIRVRTSTPTLGDLFKNLASQLDIYSKYLLNYSKAIETLRFCCQHNEQFNGIAGKIKLKSEKYPTTIQELLHKPVARVQKNALVLHDLLKYTEANSEEHKSLQTALRMTQHFLNDLNVAATENLFLIQDKAQRRLVKESFIIESSDGKRKLRHLFLFNDILVCAKYKASNRQKFTFDPKWYASLADISLPDESSPIKENSGDIMTLRSKVSINRDEIYKVEKSKPNSKLYEKLKKKQVELESQLVLLLPQLQFSIKHKNSKHYTFYLSSEFERTQWIESICVLQQSATNHEHLPYNVIEIQTWIETCRKSLNPNVGSFLLRSMKDEELLYGDLYLNMIKLSNFRRNGEFFVCIETDTYGHFFHKMSTKTVRSNISSINATRKLAPFRTNTINSNNSTLSSTNSDAASIDDLSSNSVNENVAELQFDQEFVLDLDGTKIIRFLLFEEVGDDEKPLNRGKATLELSRNWLKDKVVMKEIAFSNCVLGVTLKFISSESSTIRFPAGKVYGAFGVAIQSVAKKEKSDIPYLIIGCVREVERRGMKEIGIYRVSGLSSDIHKLKKAFEINPYEAEHLLKEIDIHAVTGLLKMYLRELPEALFTNSLYRKFFDAFGISNNDEKASKLIELFLQLPLVNQNTINFLIEHLTNVNNYENYNKMSLNNLATVFGPTMIYPGNNSTNLSANSGPINSDQFTAGTIDVMAQAGILFFFLKRKSEKLINS